MICLMTKKDGIDSVIIISFSFVRFGSQVQPSVEGYILIEKIYDGGLCGYGISLHIIELYF